MIFFFTGQIFDPAAYTTTHIKTLNDVEEWGVKEVRILVLQEVAGEQVKKREGNINETK